MEDNLDELVSLVFTKPPQAPKTIQLQLDDSSATVANESTLQDMCHLIAIKGAIKLFQINSILQLDRKQVGKLSEYMASMGVDMHVKCNMTEESPFDVTERGDELNSVELSYTFL